MVILQQEIWTFHSISGKKKTKNEKNIKGDLTQNRHLVEFVLMNADTILPLQHEQDNTSAVKKAK